MQQILQRFAIFKKLIKNKIRENFLKQYKKYIIVTR